MTTPFRKHHYQDPVVQERRGKLLHAFTSFVFRIRQRHKTRQPVGYIPRDSRYQDKTDPEYLRKEAWPSELLSIRCVWADGLLKTWLNTQGNVWFLYMERDIDLVLRKNIIMDSIRMLKRDDLSWCVSLVPWRRGTSVSCQLTKKSVI